MTSRRCAHFLPGFRATCVTVGVIWVFLAGGLLARGVRASMAGYGVPEATLASPHYHDAIWWVYSHMIVLGLVLVVVGLYAEGARFKQRFARLLLAAGVYYTVLDVRASDSALGTGLYQGAASLAPAVVGVVVTLLFAHVAFCRKACGIE